MFKKWLSANYYLFNKSLNCNLYYSLSFLLFLYNVLNISVNNIGMTEYPALSNLWVITKYPPTKVKIANTRLNIENIFDINFSLFLAFKFPYTYNLYYFLLVIL